MRVHVLMRDVHGCVRVCVRVCAAVHGEWISVWFMGGYIRLKRLEQERDRKSMGVCVVCVEGPKECMSECMHGCERLRESANMCVCGFEISPNESPVNEGEI